MCIYCGTNKYRKIYEQHYRTIPKDSEGRTYDIHHLDGNHKNNNPENLKAVSIKEHYNIHYLNKDWMACHRMSKRMNFSPEEISRLGKLAQEERVKNGTHNFLGGSLQRKLITDGTHPFLNGKIQSENNKKRWEDGTHSLIGKNEERIKNGTHNWIGEFSNKKRIEDGTHNWIQTWTCNHCGKSGKNNSLFVRWGHNTGKCIEKRDFLPKSIDKKVYNWQNIKTGEILNLTRWEMARTTEIKSRDLYMLVSGRRKSVKGWTILGRP